MVEQAVLRVADSQQQQVVVVYLDYSQSIFFWTGRNP